jgi:hypothetical protein
MKDISSSWESLKSSQKIFLVVTTIVVLFVLWNKFKGQIKAAGKTISNTSEVGALNNNGIKASYPREKYKTFAKYLFNAIDPWNTDEQTVFGLFGYLKNDVDFIELDKAFGVKTPTDNYFGLVADKNMRDFIKASMSVDEIKQLNQVIKNNGMTKRI